MKTKHLVIIKTNKWFWVQEQVEQMEREKEALLTEMEQLKERMTILKNELDERLQEIYRLRVGATFSNHM